MTENELLFLKRLSEAFAPSGCENEVRELLISELEPCVDSLRVDRMGNLIVTKGDPQKIVICAHMDEVGFMITDIQEDGTLRIGSVGGISPASLPSKRVVIGDQRITGVIGAKPIHLAKNEQKEIQLSDLYIHIGADSKEDAEKKVSVGDFAVFDTDFTVSSDGMAIFGKALDNRLGCFLLCKLIRENGLKDGTFVFSVQEETGLRGASAFADDSDYSFAIALDTTTANDLPGVAVPQVVCRLEKGPVISFLDGATIYNRDLVRDAFSRLDSENIPAQTKMRRAGGNDASALQKRGPGHLVLSLSVPCRYIHGPLGLTSVSDIDNSFRALVLLANAYSTKEAQNA